ncbi:prolyl oligopeptidase family serine peptidase [Casimicrobium huifangae]|jgi:dipeptidyl aminopeptidase/acylaminoacyl peptidase|uniref:S9 family peptidase n=1 Tax=Casimicrobium huifangae TaxID=2591109 RepID=UPI002C8488C5|nr:S9 family peptidase [Casimicrobium huifangae]
MNFRHWLTTLTSASLIAATAVSAQAQPAKQYPLRDFFKNPEQGYFRLSPDGKMLGFMQPYESRMNIFVQPIDKAGSKEGVKRITAETARDISNYFFKGPQHVLYTKDFGGDENFHVVMADITTGKVQDLTPHEGTQASILDALPDDDDHILVTHNKRDKRLFDVYRINIKTGAETLVAQNPGNITAWNTDHAGKVRAAGATDGVNKTLLYRETEAEPFKPLLTTNFREAVDIVGWTPDSKLMYVASNRGRDKAALFEFDPKTAKEGKLIYENPNVDVDSLGWSRARKVITQTMVNFEKAEPVFFDKESERVYKALKAKLPGYQIGVQSMTKDENLLIVAASNDRTPGTRYVYDVKADKLTKLAEINPALAEADMAEVKPISYTARDGLTIRGYLTLPKGVPAKNLPVIVNPHGGPWYRDSWGYNGEIQFLANRGYAVLQMNFRGSVGYGRKFWEASFKQWGLAMQDDITDGVNWLIKEGIADPKRIAIYGASYGGYATLMGVTKTPDLYAAAVDYVGVSNMFTFMKSIPPYWKPFLEMMTEMVGDAEKDKAQLTTTSPALNAERIKTPLFIAQGAKDPRVVKAESDQMVEALKKRGVAVEYMVKDNEGHGFRLQENQFEFYEAMEKFLGKHLKAAK